MSREISAALAAFPISTAICFYREDPEIPLGEQKQIESQHGKLVK